MTSIELVEHWEQQDRDDDERDSQSSSSSIDSEEHASQSNSPESSARRNKVGPLLLLDVRSKSERTVSTIPGACSMDDLETIRWINKYVHGFEGKQLRCGTPTIVMYCTIGYRSGREAQRLYDDLTTTFDIDIGSNTVEIKNLDGILAYSFVDNAPPLMYPATSDGGSDYHMTKRIHSFGKDWSTACNPDYDVVYFNTKPKLCKHLLQTGFISAVRVIQHLVSKSIKKTKKTKVIKNVCIEPLPVLNISIGRIPKILGGNGSHSTSDLTALDNNNNSNNSTDLNTLKRISLTGYTTNVNDANAATTTTDTCTVATTTSNNTNTPCCANSNNNIISSTTTTNETAVR